MSVRQWLNQNALVTVTLALVATAVAAFFVVRALTRPRGDSGRSWTTMAYFYDQNTGQLFEVPADTVGPIETDSGPYRGMPAGVRAYVFACGQCSDESLRFVGHLEAPVDAVPADAIAGQPASEGEDAEGEDMVIRRPADEKWVYPSSREGKAIIDEPQSKCSSDAPLNYCKPPPRPG
ncbi:MAG: hypothetical protein ACYSWU_00645 [Planctomycetota bacterium]|jgi:hypothetical protein